MTVYWHVCVVCGVWCVVCGVWCVVCGLWCVACGVWCVMFTTIFSFLLLTQVANLSCML